jgi:hypothetical protein
MKTNLLFITVLVLFIFACKPKQVEPLPQHGLLWKITGNGLNHTSYLFGTCHISGGMQILDSIKTFDSIFSLTNRLICEFQLSDFTKHLKGKEENDFNFLKPWPVPDSTYNNLLTAKQKIIFDSVVNSSELLKKIKQANLNIRPLSFLNFIKLSKKIEPNSDKAQSPLLDFYLQNLAKKRDMQIVSLDSEKEYQKIKDSITTHHLQLSYRNEVDVLMYYIKNQHHIDSLKQDMTNKLLSAYLKQDINFIMHQSEEINLHNNKILSYLGNDKFQEVQQKMMIDERNNLWMNKIPKLIENNSSFIAVGAAHLGGEKGLINQLRELNYTVNSVK